ncbi:sugar transporter [Coniophora puteana RWD-64-598 SS2]|uniref:Sugar transporter n=1 Tax=Coniophora puteana (strain RWD-64-598) TaxID=741705 RepID=A0A5M3MJX5_CONPW|nr:sugar transporter [Coniophora puteana RWD-64-598 SS2]EIW79528.1 sugar transporter [Coniophora puteana RWD-64-598 SS2]
MASEPNHGGSRSPSLEDDNEKRNTIATTTLSANAASKDPDAAFQDVLAHTQAGEISEAAVVAEGAEHTTWFVIGVVACCSISGLLFGYDTGVISGALVSIGGDLGPAELSDGQKEFITSSTTLGALLGGLAAGALSDITGRRPVLGLADVLFIGGAIGQAVCHTVWSMIGCRLLVGLGVGLASCIAPLYIQELAPTRLRGRLVVLNVVLITLGQVIAYGIDAGFENVPHGWRWMVGLGAVPAGIQAALVLILPESPRILVRRGDIEDAHKVLGKIYKGAKAEQVELKLRVLRAAVQQSIDIANSTTFLERIRSMISVPVNRRALIVACGLQAYQQLCGFNTLMYYSASLFAEIGFDQPTAVGLIVAGTNFLFTLIALRWIDVIGRRRIMLWSAPGMVVGLVVASIAFHFMTRNTGGQLVSGSHYETGWSAVVLLSMIVFVASYATGLGNVPWQQGELFSLEVRGIGTSLATATNWGANLLIGSTYLSLMARITPAGAFGFYAGLCFLGWVFCVGFFPETAGLSLEEVQVVFRNGFGIKESRRLREEKRAFRIKDEAEAEKSAGRV